MAITYIARIGCEARGRGKRDSCENANHLQQHVFG
jgi:hypothetical protein